MDFTPKETRAILGRVIEGLGIGLVAGSVVSFAVIDFRFWYFLIFGAILTATGVILYEANK